MRSLLGDSAIIESVSSPPWKIRQLYIEPGEPVIHLNKHQLFTLSRRRLGSSIYMHILFGVHSTVESFLSIYWYIRYL